MNIRMNIVEIELRKKTTRAIWIIEENNLSKKRHSSLIHAPYMRLLNTLNCNPNLIKVLKGV